MKGWGRRGPTTPLDGPRLQSAIDALRRGDPVVAERWASAVLAEAVRQGDLLETCRAAGFISQVALMTGRADVAAQHADLVLQQPIIGDLRNNGLATRAEIAAAVGDRDLVRTLLEELDTNFASADPQRRDAGPSTVVRWRRLRASVRIEDGDLPGARADMDEAARLVPGHLTVRVARAAMLALQGEATEAVDDLNRWLREADRVPRERRVVQEAIARLHIQEGDLVAGAAATAALEAELTATGEDPASDVAVLMLNASMRTESGVMGAETGGLLETLLGRPDLGPIRRASVHAMRAEVRLDSGDVAGARADIDEALTAIESASDRVLLAETLAIRARIAVAEGATQAARSDIARAVDALGDVSAPAVVRQLGVAQDAIAEAGG